MAWQKLQPARAVPKTRAEYKVMARDPGMQRMRPGITWRVIKEEYERADLWKNDKYQVDKRDMGADPAGGRIVWLSIKRLDREPIHDWRDLQQIKNDLCGPEAEGFELYPAESRVVDTSNQYHLWVFTKQRIEFGWQTGERMTPEQAAKVGAKQRGWD